MKLFSPHLERSATHYWVQVGHRRTAITCAIECIAKVRDIEISDDENFFGMEELMSHWVSETLLQGAFLREYHMWEKETKEYFGNQLRWNGDGRSFPSRGGSDSHVRKVAKVLKLFSASVDAFTLEGLDLMRDKVNAAKHSADLSADASVTFVEYEEAIAIIERFWDELIGQENFRPLANHPSI